MHMEVKWWKSIVEELMFALTNKLKILQTVVVVRAVAAIAAAFTVVYTPVVF